MYEKSLCGHFRKGIFLFSDVVVSVLGSLQDAFLQIFGEIFSYMSAGTFCRYFYLMNDVGLWVDVSGGFACAKGDRFWGQGYFPLSIR